MMKCFKITKVPKKFAMDVKSAFYSRKGYIHELFNPFEVNTGSISTLDPIALVF